ncbi:MAG: hypothetical protein QXP58_08550 [Thermoprotei archaeon]
MLLPELKEVFDELRSGGIQIDEGFVFNYQDLEAEYRFQIQLGLKTSRLDTLKTILQSHLERTIEVKDVLEVSAFTIPNFENLVGLGIVKFQGGILRIPFHDILRQVDSTLVVLTFRKRVGPEFRDIVSPHISQSTSTIGEKKIAYFEAVLDYAELWKQSVTSFSVRNIVFTIILELYDADLEAMLSQSFKKRIREVDAQILKGNPDAIAFINVLTEEFLKFESDESTQEYRAMISFDPPTVAETLEVIPKMKYRQLGESNYPLVLPGSIQVKTRTKIPENSFKVTGKIEFDLSRFRLFLEQVVKRVEERTAQLSV